MRSSNTESPPVGLILTDVRDKHKPRPAMHMSADEIELELTEIEDRLDQNALTDLERSAKHERWAALMTVWRQLDAKRRSGAARGKRRANSFAGSQHDLRAVQDIRLEQERRERECWVSLAAFYHVVEDLARERGVEPPISKWGLTKRLNQKRKWVRTQRMNGQRAKPTERPKIASRRQSGAGGDWEIELGSMLNHWHRTGQTRNFGLPSVADMYERIQSVAASSRRDRVNN